MTQHAICIATAQVRPGSEEAFFAWQARHSATISNSSGFISTDMIPPPAGQTGGSWTIIQKFESEEALIAWQQSPDHGAIVAEALPLITGGSFEETISADGAGLAPVTEVTEVIFSKVKPGLADRYREWVARIQAAQAKYPGYRGMYLQPPAGGRDGHWISILRYDSVEHLEAWMNAPERKRLLTETQEFIESEELMRLATAYPGWVPLDPMTGEGPPNWKTALLVLLGLFPIVMLEMKYLSPILSAWSLNNSLATFIGNFLSVGLTSFLTMPWFVRGFGWWLFPKAPVSTSTSAGGVLMICTLFALEVMLFWNFMG